MEWAGIEHATCPCDLWYISSPPYQLSHARNVREWGCNSLCLYVCCLLCVCVFCVCASLLCICVLFVNNIILKCNSKTCSVIYKEKNIYKKWQPRLEPWPSGTTLRTTLRTTNSTLGKAPHPRKNHPTLRPTTTRWFFHPRVKNHPIIFSSDTHTSTHTHSLWVCVCVVVVVGLVFY